MPSAAQSGPLSKVATRLHAMPYLGDAAQSNSNLSKNNPEAKKQRGAQRTPDDALPN